MRISKWVKIAVFPVVLYLVISLAVTFLSSDHTSTPRDLYNGQTDPYFTPAPTVSLPPVTTATPPSTIVVVGAPDPSPPPSLPPSGTMVTVPNVVGLNHQVAQDTMQAAGLYLLFEKDATGQNRLLVMDSNWVVVSQSPAAGSVVDSMTAVTLSSKKLGE